MNPILTLAGLGAAAWYLLKDKGYATVPAPAAGTNKVTTTIPTPDGKGITITTDAQIADIMMQTAGTGNAPACLALAKKLDKMGKTNEAAAMRGLAQMITAHQATKSPKASSAPVASAADLGRINAAIQSGDPRQMRNVATDLRKKGLVLQAQSLELAASQIEASKKAGTPVQVTPVPTTTPAVVVTPAALPAPKATSPAPSTPTKKVVLSERRRAADVLARHLLVNPPRKGREEQGLVAIYQRTAALKDDGLYGPATARSMADSESGGYVPPSPRRWPRRSYAQAASDYEQWLESKAQADPARAAEWRAAKARAREFYPVSTVAKKAQAAPAIKVSRRELAPGSYTSSIPYLPMR